MLGDLMNALMQSGSGPQQQQQQQNNSGGSDMLSQVVGGLLGGGQQSGGAPIDLLLGGLAQVIGGTPGTGQPMTMNQNQANVMTNANSPIMGLLQPVVNHVSATTGIPPQIATAVAGIALHYLLSSHSAAGGNSSLNLGSMIQQISSGNTNMDTMHKSGMVKDVMQATGLTQSAAANALNETFNHLQSHVNPGGMKKVKKGSSDA
jgi:hypothetical protein